MLTEYHAKYFAYELTKRGAADSILKLAASLADVKATVDLNPHQVEAALFAFRSPLSKGAILADEVGLGKTIEAGLVISQKWAERKRKILIIVPSNLRKQWNQELLDKFFLSSVILENASFNQEIKKGNLNPFEQGKVVICSYQFARKMDVYIKKIQWDLIVIDEAHRLRNVYKPSSKIANAIKEAVAHAPKILLTATPLQNTLLELFGLVSIIDDYTFGDLKSYKSQFSRLDGSGNFDDLKARLKPVCIRNLRRQVLEYIQYTNRKAVVQEFIPSDAEQRLYELVSEYLQRENLYALPTAQRQLMTLILRRLLASSTFAISGTLEGLASKLDSIVAEQKAMEIPQDNIAENFETFEEIKDEWVDDEEQDDNGEEKPKRVYSPVEIEQIKKEIADLKEFAVLAKSIMKNSKGEVLMTALKRGFTEIKRLGGNKKVIIFTESTRTQAYLKQILENTEYRGKIVLFNGSNNDSESKGIFEQWMKKHEGTDHVTGSKTADKRAAIVEYFRDEATIMIATEAAAEGINLQFCSLVVNYDLPWNPQRIEQRIGRCHRYGQEFDVVVVNFLNKKNEADQRVYQLLDQKFRLFTGVFGASDEVLGSIESGVDFEKRIAQIYQTCRTPDEIGRLFDQLQKDLEEQIADRMNNTRQKLLENFDEEVHEKLRVNLEESKNCLSKYEHWLWQITRFFLEPYAKFDSREDSFTLVKNPFPGEVIHPGPYRVGKGVDDANIYRVGHPLAQRIIEQCKHTATPNIRLTFHYSDAPKKISIIDSLVKKSGWLMVKSLTITSFESEDHVLLFGMTDDGKVLEEEQCQRLFSVSANKFNFNDQGALDITGQKINNLYEDRRKAILAQMSARDGRYFETELDKMDKWAEDRRESLRVDLKDVEDRVKDLKKQARLASNLPEKLKLEKERRQLETKRDAAWRTYEQEAKVIESKKDSLIDEIEKKLKPRINEETLFMIRWEVV